MLFLDINTRPKPGKEYERYKVTGKVKGSITGTIKLTLNHSFYIQDGNDLRQLNDERLVSVNIAGRYGGQAVFYGTNQSIANEEVDKSDSDFSLEFYARRNIPKIIQEAKVYHVPPGGNMGSFEAGGSVYRFFWLGSPLWDSAGLPCVWNPQPPLFIDFGPDNTINLGILPIFCLAGG